MTREEETKNQKSYCKHHHVTHYVDAHQFFDIFQFYFHSIEKLVLHIYNVSCCDTIQICMQTNCPNPTNVCSVHRCVFSLLRFLLHDFHKTYFLLHFNSYYIFLGLIYYYCLRLCTSISTVYAVRLLFIRFLFIHSNTIPVPAIVGVFQRPTTILCFWFHLFVMPLGLRFIAIKVILHVFMHVDYAMSKKYSLSVDASSSSSLTPIQ